MPSATKSDAPRPVEPIVLERLAAIARAALGRASLEGAPLAAELRRVSALYNAGLAPEPNDVGALCARLRFFLPRDLPKIEGPLRELARVGALPRRTPLRVLDLGAGLGTSSLGLARFCAALGAADRLVVDAIDRDEGALELAVRIAADASRLGAVPVDLRPHALDLASLDATRLRPPYDVVLLGLVASELAPPDADEAAAAAAHVDRVRRIAELAAPDGAIVVLEPALRGPSRALHRVRDALVQAGGPPFVFAPCVRRGDCPMLVRPRDWCHESVALELPPELARLARAAGLREQDLTYSYLTLHMEARSLRELAPVPLLRIVGGPLRSKGKIEVYVCGDAPVRRLRELDRHARRDARRLGDLGRGDLLAVDDAVESRGEAGVLGPSAGVRVVK